MDDATRAMTPAQRMTKGLCPECGVSLDGLSVAFHSSTHWKNNLLPDGQNDEALARQRMMREYHSASAEVK